MHLCVMPHTSRAASGGYSDITSHLHRPSFKGRDQATAIGALPLAAKNAGAAERRPEERRDRRPRRNDGNRRDGDRRFGNNAGPRSGGERRFGRNAGGRSCLD